MISFRIVLATVLLTLSAIATPVRAARPPNVVFIMADDLGFAELGCYGQKKIRTPHIDRLARGGMRFTRNYAGNAVCAPSRCVLMTGKHPGHAWVRSNKEVRPEGQTPIPATEVTVAELLKTDGYATGAFGKWGLGPPGSAGGPLKQGFDRFFGYNCQRHAHSYYPSYLWDDNQRIVLRNNPAVGGHARFPKDVDATNPGNYSRFKGQDYAPDRIAAQAIRFIQQKDGLCLARRPGQFADRDVATLPEARGQRHAAGQRIEHGADYPVAALHTGTEAADTQDETEKDQAQP